MPGAPGREVRPEPAAPPGSGLRNSARPSSAGPVRRALGNGFVRLGLLLGSDGSVPPSVVQTASRQEAPAPAGVSAFVLPSDLAREQAAPYGLRVGDVLSRTRSRSGSRPGAPSARSHGSRRPARSGAR